MTKENNKGPKLGWFAAARESVWRAADRLQTGLYAAMDNGKVDLAMGIATVGLGGIDRSRLMVYGGTAIAMIGVNKFGRSLVKQMKGGGSAPTPTPC